MRVIDLTGQRFGKLTALYRATNGNFGNARWVCLCECGKQIRVDSHNLRRGQTKSCGCFDTHHRYNDETLSSKNFLYTIYKGSAKERGIKFSLKFEDLIHIVQQRCHYCGSPPTKLFKAQRARKGFLCHGIDRLDNEGDYVLENAVPCCKDCNYAKMEKTQEDFRKWIDKCYHNLNLGDK